MSTNDDVCSKKYNDSIISLISQRCPLNTHREAISSDPAFENDLFLSAFLKVLNIVGEQSKELILIEVKKKYGVSLQSKTRPITPKEIEDSVMDLFEIAGDLIMTMVKAEYYRIA
jgi:hypothetical protein